METIYLNQHGDTTARSRLLDAEMARVEHLLMEAGLGFTEVTRCPAADCEVCDAVLVGVAA